MDSILVNTYFVRLSHNTSLYAIAILHGRIRIAEHTPALVRISFLDSFLGPLGDPYFIDWIGFWSHQFCGWFKIGFFSGWHRFHGWERMWQLERETMSLTIHTRLLRHSFRTASQIEFQFAWLSEEDINLRVLKSSPRNRKKPEPDRD